MEGFAPDKYSYTLQLPYSTQPGSEAVAVSLVRILGVDARVEGNFDDISSDDYYYKEIGIAKKLVITTGTGNNKFSPEASITRQDMMALTERYLRMLKKEGGLVTFGTNPPPAGARSKFRDGS